MNLNSSVLATCQRMMTFLTPTRAEFKYRLRQKIRKQLRLEGHDLHFAFVPIYAVGKNQNCIQNGLWLMECFKQAGWEEVELVFGFKLYINPDFSIVMEIHAVVRKERRYYDITPSEGDKDILFVPSEMAVNAKQRKVILQNMQLMRTDPTAALHPRTGRILVTDDPLLRASMTAHPGDSMRTFASAQEHIIYMVRKTDGEVFELTRDGKLVIAEL